jgi:hypothetical protein
LIFEFVVDRADGMAEDGVGGAGGGGEFGGALEDFEAGVAAELEDLFVVGGQYRAGDEFALAGVVESVGEDGFAQEGAEGFAGETDAAAAGHDDGKDGDGGDLRIEI